MRSIRPTRITVAAAVALAMLASQVGHAAPTVRPARPNPTGMVAKIDAASRSLSPATGSVMLPLTQSQGPNLGTWSIGEIDIPLNATGGAGGYTWSVIGSLPPGISLRTGFWASSVAAGLLGVATTPGDYSFTLSVTSGAETVEQPCTLKVTALTTTENRVPDAFVGVPYSHSLTALGGGTIPVTWTPSGGVPAGMTLAPDGTLSGTPTTAGIYSVKFTVGNGTDTVNRGAGLRVSAIQITTAGATPGVLPNVIQDVPYSASVSASPAGSYTFTADGLPSVCRWTRPAPFWYTFLQATGHVSAHSRST